MSVMDWVVTIGIFTTAFVMLMGWAISYLPEGLQAWREMREEENQRDQ